MSARWPCVNSTPASNSAGCTSASDSSTDQVFEPVRWIAAQGAGRSGATAWTSNTTTRPAPPLKQTPARSSPQLHDHDLRHPDHVTDELESVATPIRKNGGSEDGGRWQRLSSEGFRPLTHKTAEAVKTIVHHYPPSSVPSDPRPGHTTADGASPEQRRRPRDNPTLSSIVNGRRTPNGRGLKSVRSVLSTEGSAVDPHPGLPSFWDTASPRR